MGTLYYFTESAVKKGRSMDRLYKKLEAYGKSDFYPFHMPGHKRNPLSVAGDFSVQQDITEINGFDNLHHPETILKEAQENAARLYQVQESFFLSMEAPGQFWQPYLLL